MKKICFIVLTFLTSALLCLCIAAAETPDIISNADELLAMNNSGNYVLAADIDLSGISFSPLFADDAFTGSLDGAGYKIIGLTITEANQYNALIAKANGAVIKNIILENVYINIDSSVSAYDNVYVAGICAYAEGSTVIENCKVSGNINANASKNLNTAGIVGATYLNCQIKNCTNSATIFAIAKESVQIGGILGYAERKNSVHTTVSECVNTGIISVDTESTGFIKAGGIAGKGERLELIKCANNAAININSNGGVYASGLIASASGDGTVAVEECLNTGDISVTSANATISVAGLFADASKIVIRNCLNTANIIGNGVDVPKVSGLIASSRSGTTYTYDTISVGTVSNTSDISFKMTALAVASCYSYDKYSNVYVMSCDDTEVFGVNMSFTGVSEFDTTEANIAETFAGLDFENVWYMGKSHPELRAFAEVKTTIGDTNGDGKVDLSDAVSLSRFLANWPDYTNLDTTTLDLNGDAKVNLTDAVIISRHIAAWAGYENLPLAN